MNTKNKKKVEEPKPELKAAQIEEKLLLIASRIKIRRMSKEKEIKKQIEAASNYLKHKKIGNAKVAMQIIMTEQNKLTVFEILEFDCKMLQRQCEKIVANDTLKSNIRKHMDNLIYAAKYVSLEGMADLRELVALKFGDYYISQADKPSIFVNEDLITLVTVKKHSDHSIMARLKQLNEFQEDCPTESEVNVPVYDRAVTIGSEESPISSNPYPDLDNPYIGTEPNQGPSNYFTPTKGPIGTEPNQENSNTYKGLFGGLDRSKTFKQEKGCGLFGLNFENKPKNTVKKGGSSQKLNLGKLNFDAQSVEAKLSKAKLETKKPQGQVNEAEKKAVKKSKPSGKSNDYLSKKPKKKEEQPSYFDNPEDAQSIISNNYRMPSNYANRLSNLSSESKDYSNMSFRESTITAASSDLTESEIKPFNKKSTLSHKNQSNIGDDFDLP